VRDLDDRGRPRSQRPFCHLHCRAASAKEVLVAMHVRQRASRRGISGDVLRPASVNGASVSLHFAQAWRVSACDSRPSPARVNSAAFMARRRGRCYLGRIGTRDRQLSPATLRVNLCRACRRRIRRRQCRRGPLSPTDSPLARVISLHPRGSSRFGHEASSTQ